MLVSWAVVFFTSCPIEIKIPSVKVKITKIGINGFLRIGRLVLRVAETALNDPFIDLNFIVYLLRFHSIYDHFKSTVSAKKAALGGDGEKVIVLTASDTANLNWTSAGADYVVEVTGIFTTNVVANSLPKRPATYDQIKLKVMEASDGPMKGVLDSVNRFVSHTHSSVFDAKAGIPLDDQYVKLILWYDNELGYSNCVIDLIKYNICRARRTRAKHSSLICFHSAMFRSRFGVCCLFVFRYLHPFHVSLN